MRISTWIIKLTTGGKPLSMKLLGKREAEKTLDYESSRKLHVIKQFSDNDMRYFASNNNNYNDKNLKTFFLYFYWLFILHDHRKNNS